MSENETEAPQEVSSYDYITYEMPYEKQVESADPFTSGRDGIQEAADELTERREPRREQVSRVVVDPNDYTKIAPGNVAISKETAADSLREHRNFEAWAEQEALDRLVAEDVDRFRADQQPPQPEIAQPQSQAPEVQAEYAAEPDDELTRLLSSVPDEAVRRNVRQGLIQYHADQQTQIAQAREAAVAHANAAAAALEQRTLETFLVAEQAALAPFPELANVRRDDMQVVLNHIRQSNPERFEQIDRHVARVKGLAANQLQTMQVLHQQQHAVQQQQQAMQAQNLKAWADAQDRAFEKTSWANESPQSRDAITREIVDAYKQYGISEQELAHHYQNNPAMRHAATQALLLDGIRYRQAQRSIPRAVARPVPSVQRPGVSSPEARDHSELASFQKSFNLNPTAKNAAALLTARRGAR
jgi:hypothetical protein